MHKCFFIAAEAFQCQIGFMIDVQNAWEGNLTWIFHLNMPFDAILRLKKSKTDTKRVKGDMFMYTRDYKLLGKCSKVHQGS